MSEPRDIPAAFRKKRKPRGKPFEKGNKVGNRFKLGESGNPDGRPQTTRTPSEVLQEIERMAFANMQDYVSIDESGKWAGLDFSKLTREQWAAVQEITEDTTGGAGDGERKMVLRTRMKLADKIKNLEILCRHHKLLTDKVEVTTSEELINRLSAGRRRVASQ